MRWPNPIGIDEDHPAGVVANLRARAVPAIGCLADYDSLTAFGCLATGELDGSDERIDIRRAPGVEQEAAKSGHRERRHDRAEPEDEDELPERYTQSA